MIGGKSLAALGIGLLLVGLLAGYLLWGRSTRTVMDELADVKARLGEQTRRADELQSKFAETESDLRQAAEGLRRERELRERFEDLVSKGRK